MAVKTESPAETLASGELILRVNSFMNNGSIQEAVDCFAPDFIYRDNGAGVEFSDKPRLADFLRKIRELYPEALTLPDRILLCGDHAVSEWTQQATMPHPAYAGLARRISITVHGASVVQSRAGKITSWTDYYDGLAGCRTPLAAHFSPWLEF